MRVSRRGVVALVAAALLVTVLPAIAMCDEESVVVSRPGVIFHKVGSQDVRGHAYGKSLSQAVAAGYTPCPICFGKAESSARPAMTAGAFGSSFAMGHLVVAASQAGGVFVIHQASGVQLGVVHAQGSGGRGIPDPYILNQTMRIKPLAEEGAYSTSRK
jgi:hypothetical protein